MPLPSTTEIAASIGKTNILRARYALINQTHCELESTESRTDNQEPVDAVIFNGWLSGIQVLMIRPWIFRQSRELLFIGFGQLEELTEDVGSKSLAGFFCISFPNGTQFVQVHFWKGLIRCHDVRSSTLKVLSDLLDLLYKTQKCDASCGFDESILISR